MGSFATSDEHEQSHLQPIRVPAQRGHVYHSAKEMIADLDGWSLSSEDEARGVLVCAKSNGFLGGTSTITITLEGPEGLPSTTVHVRSESRGGLFSKDKSNVAAFVRPFFRRVC
jgi:hypothetical protein